MEDMAAGRSCYTTSIAQFLCAYWACQNILQLKRLDTLRTLPGCGPVHVCMQLRLPRKVRQSIHRTIHDSENSNAIGPFFFKKNDITTAANLKREFHTARWNIATSGQLSVSDSLSLSLYLSLSRPLASSLPFPLSICLSGLSLPVGRALSCHC